MYVYHRRAMSGYVVRQTPKKVSSQKTAGFAEKLVWHVWKKTTNAERQAQLNTNHWIHSQRSAHLFIKALGQSLRFVRWRPGVSGMSSPVHPMPSPICSSVLGIPSGCVCKLWEEGWWTLDATVHLLSCYGLELVQTTTRAEAGIPVVQMSQWTTLQLW